jgi:hypothetical protein
MIHIQNGNLLKSDCDIIAHCCNCQGGFGSGIAGQIRKEFPYAYEAFKLDNRDSKDKFGTYSLGLSDYSARPITVSKQYDFFNLYGQFDYGYDNKQYVSYEALLSSMIMMMEKIIDWKSLSTKNFKIGMPYLIGCGLAGGDWKTVEELILNVSCQFSTDIYLYRFTP